jgi:nitroimidazol reductase NimA-like FMN-containing flavoprotein (pyridoxamine 5'-phosphate oxidase superfamily)
MHCRSVIGYGMAAILTDPGEKTHRLTGIMRHYDGSNHEFSDSDIALVSVIRIAVESMIGKKHD